LETNIIKFFIPEPHSYRTDEQDQNNFLHSIDSIVYQNSAWLEGRIKMEFFHFSHPKIENWMLQILGVKGLSFLVKEEILQEDTEIENNFAKNISETIKSKEFCDGIARILNHEKNKIKKKTALLKNYLIWRS